MRGRRAAHVGLVGLALEEADAVVLLHEGGLLEQVQAVVVVQDADGLTPRFISH